MNLDYGRSLLAVEQVFENMGESDMARILLEPTMNGIEMRVYPSK